MNFKKGLTRLYTVLTVGWLLLCLIPPRITDATSARRAARYGVFCCWVWCVLAACFGVAALVLSRPVRNVDGWILLDLVIVATSAWRVQSKTSRTWATVALLDYSFGIVRQAVEGPISGLVFPVQFFFMWGYVNGVRGTLAYRTFQPSLVVAESPTLQSSETRAGKTHAAVLVPPSNP